MSSKISVVMFGARRHYAVPRILHSGQILERLYTDINAIQGWPRLLSTVPTPWLPKSLRNLRGRVPTGIPVKKITSFPMFGLLNQIRLARCNSLIDSLRTHERGTKELNQLIISKGNIESKILYTFDRAGLELMQYFKRRGGTCVMEQTCVPIRIDRRMAIEEQQLYPDWESKTPSLLDLIWLAEREEAEWELAERIICPSEHVRKSIGACGGPVERCRVVPYGIDERFAGIQREEHTGPLRVLTVGAINLGKGAPYVLETARRLSGKAEFRMVGAVRVTEEARKSLAEHIELTGQVPRTEIAEHFAWADLFFLPSLNEGSALVAYEALSAGLPVVCTTNTGSIVRNGKNGYIVPIRDVGAMCDVLSRLADDRVHLNTLAYNARGNRSDYSFESYRDRLLNCLRDI